ncbi:hypothetical protein Tco_0014493 [Tanacetum coccineum]
MRTRSQSREQRPPPPEEPPVVIEPLRIEYPFQEDPPVEPMADTRTMAQLLQAPTEGYEDAILIPEIVANNFELKHGLINLVQNKQFFGHDKEDPHAHILSTNSSTQAVSSGVAELKDIVRAIALRQEDQASARLQSCTSKHQNQLHRPQVNQSPAYQAPVPQTHSVTKNDFDNYVKANDAIMRNMQNNLQNQGQSMQIETNKLNNQMANLTDMLAKFVTANTASTSGSGTLPGNTVTNPREDLKGITTRSGVAYQGPPIPTSSVVKPIPEVTKDQVHPSCSQSTAPVQPPVGPEPITTPVFEPIVAPVVAPVPNTKPSVSLPYPLSDNERP